LVREYRAKDEANFLSDAASHRGAKEELVRTMKTPDAPSPAATPQDSEAPTFLYHQSAALLANIAFYIDQAKPASLLDIGAGSGKLAIPLAQRVQKYLAIESEPTRSAALKEAGVDVVSRHFPTEIGDAFDFILSSHSIPEKLEEYPAFLRGAWELLKPGGALLIVTYKGREGNIAILRRELLGGDWDCSPELDLVKQTLSDWGRMSIEKVNSYAEAENPDEIIAYFESWLTGDAQTKLAIRDRFRRIIEARFRVRAGRYVFPTEHVFVSCVKPG
jgi:SAM-dependent methyltransferase